MARKKETEKSHGKAHEKEQKSEEKSDEEEKNTWEKGRESRLTMMFGDVFQEVDEELESERLYKFWLKNKKAIVGSISLFFLGLFIYVGMEAYQESQDRDASQMFQAVLEVNAQDEKGKQTRNEKLTALLKEHPEHGYATLGRFHQVQDLLKEDRKEDALKALQALAKDLAESPLQGLALLNGAYLVAEDTKKAIQLLEQIKKDSPFRGAALELKGVFAYQKGDFDMALKHYKEALSIRQSGPLAERLRQRIQRLEGPRGG
ncbi:tetratricopeptide repeat protein [Magnetococcales bacterium HHB-1]